MCRSWFPHAFDKDGVKRFLDLHSITVQTWFLERFRKPKLSPSYSVIHRWYFWRILLSTIYLKFAHEMNKLVKSWKKYEKKGVLLSFDEFFRYACKCGTIKKFVKTTTVLSLAIILHKTRLSHMSLAYIVKSRLAKSPDAASFILKTRQMETTAIFANLLSLVNNFNLWKFFGNFMFCKHKC